MMSVPFWTMSGTIDLAELRPENLTAEIIGDTLAKINRFGGRTRSPWSVAAHSVLVEGLCPPDLRPWALLHDAHEALIGDMMTPSVDFIDLCGPSPNLVKDAINAAKGRIDRVIGAAWGLPVRSMNAALRRADQVACVAEAAAFLGVAPTRLPQVEEDLLEQAMSRLGSLPRGNDWPAARELWLARIEHYARLGQLSPPKANDPADMVSAG